MDTGLISVRYARALLKGATEAKLEERVYHEMMTLAGSYANVPGLRQAIGSPMLPKERKQSLLEAAVGERTSELTRSFIRLVLQEGREGFMQFMAHSYVTLYRKQRNVIRGKLTTATLVSAETEQRMRRLVEGSTNGTVEFETEVDPGLIGGFILEYDTYRMDASVKSRLNTILNTLKK